MAIAKRYFHDKIILLLLSVNSFLVLLSSIVILLRIDNGKTSGYIFQFRPSLGLGAYKYGGVGEILAFLVFSVLVFIMHAVVSYKIYHVRRSLALTTLGLSIVLTVFSIIISNSLLILR